MDVKNNTELEYFITENCENLHFFQCDAVGVFMCAVITIPVLMVYSFLCTHTIYTYRVNWIRTYHSPWFVHVDRDWHSSTINTKISQSYSGKINEWKKELQNDKKNLYKCTKIYIVMFIASTEMLPTEGYVSMKLRMYFSKHTETYSLNGAARLMWCISQNMILYIRNSNSFTASWNDSVHSRYLEKMSNNNVTIYIFLT